MGALSVMGLILGCLTAAGNEGMLPETPVAWTAQWIAEDRPAPADEAAFFGDNPAPLFRKEFSTAKKISRAVIHATGLGYYELYLNGSRVGDRELDPGWTSYDHRIFYASYEVTDQIAAGANALGVIVGNGWYNPLPLHMWGRYNPRDALAIGSPCALIQLEITYEDGEKQILGSDTSWKSAPSPVLRNSVYIGELHDARKESPGWDRPGFDAAAWRPAILATPPKGTLEPAPIPPVRVTESLTPLSVTAVADGVYIADFGKNITGRLAIECSGPAGARIDVRYGELLYPDGRLNPMTAVCGQLKNRKLPEGSDEPATAWQQDSYILSGKGKESWHARFTFHGFRYAEITGFPGTPTPENIRAERLHTDLKPTGHFACSNDLFNRIHEITVSTLLNNVQSLQSDCPHREKFGYGGDLVACSAMAMYNFDMSDFYAKVVRDFGDAVRPNGGFTETAPYVGIADEGLGEGSGPIGWGTAHPLLEWQRLLFYGDTALIAEQYDADKKWVELLEKTAKDNLIKNGLGDHESLVEKDTLVSGSAFYYHNLRLVAGLANALGRREEAAAYTRRAAEVAKSFQEKLYDPATGKYGLGTQACQAFALYMGITPPEAREKALAVLVEDLEKHDGALTTGIFGTRYMLMALSDLGRSDLAYALVARKEFPGWGHMIEQGATSLWEHWEYSDNTFSHNHPMFGSVDEWLYAVVAGIRPAEDAVGWNMITIKPCPGGDLTWAEGRYTSVHGEIRSRWEVTDDGHITLSVTIPPDTTAEITMPCKDGGKIEEYSEKEAAWRPAPESNRTGANTFKCGPGVYQWRAPWEGRLH